jgi:hypothetical protein
MLTLLWTSLKHRGVSPGRSCQAPVFVIFITFWPRCCNRHLDLGWLTVCCDRPLLAKPATHGTQHNCASCTVCHVLVGSLQEGCLKKQALGNLLYAVSVAVRHPRSACISLHCHGATQRSSRQTVHMWPCVQLPCVNPTSRSCLFMLCLS